MNHNADICQWGTERNAFYFENVEGRWVQMASTLGLGLKVERAPNPSQLPEFGMCRLIPVPGPDTPRSDPGFAAASALCYLGQTCPLLWASAWVSVDHIKC